MAGSGFNPSMLMGGSGGGQGGGGMLQFLGGLFGNSGAPYGDAMKQFQKYFGQAKEAQNPFYNAGKDAIPGMQDWLGQMKDPSTFINNLMNKYSESPMAKNLQQASMRAGTNAASADGTAGSTPMMQQAQQNAGQISSMDQNNWLQNVLGVNNKYGEGMSHMMDTGAHSADMISQLMSQLGLQMGAGAFGQKQGEMNDSSNMWGGLLQMLTHGFGG